MADDMSKPAAWWLSGNFEPVHIETEKFDLAIEGALPPELHGTFMRVGPNPAAAPSAHWFMGDGMLHGVRLEGGRAKWYRNRYIKTERLGRTFDRNDPSTILNKRLSTGNTALARHAGKIFALEEAHFPYEIDAELNTIGCEDFGGKLKSAFTAHPKICPETGEMMSFGYGFMPPYLTYNRFDAAGHLVQAEEIPMTGATMVHDFCTTRHHVIFMDLPVVFDLPLAVQGTMPFRWSDEYPARLGVMPRAGTPADIKWFSIKPCYIFHTLNAFEENGVIQLDAVRYACMWKSGFSDAPGLLTRFTLNLKTGSVSEQTLDATHAVDFPRVPDHLIGLKHKYGYATATGDSTDGSVAFGTAVHKWDLARGTSETCEFGAGRHPGEAVFAPASNGEDSGYLMTIVHDDNTGKSEFVVVDATDVARGPIARVILPARVPYGFHGGWFADA